MKNICILGGGHGSSRLIKGFKNIDATIDVIVTSSDNGGHTGELVKEFNTPALGDLRMVLESILEKPLVDAFSYRFKRLHGKNNVSLGNLILLSLVLEYNDVNKMLEIVNDTIDNKYHMHLSNNEYVELKALDNNGNVISGECNIGECTNIKKVFLDKEGIVEDSVIEAINNSDIIVLSFGSFYTSLGAVIASNKIRKAIKESKAQLVYIPNLVNQKETKGYKVEDYVDFIEGVVDRKIDRVIISTTKIKRKIIKRYEKEDRKIVTRSENRDNYEYYSLLVVEDNKLRHNIEHLAQIIVSD